MCVYSDWFYFLVIIIVEIEVGIVWVVRIGVSSKVLVLCCWFVVVEYFYVSWIFVFGIEEVCQVGVIFDQVCVYGLGFEDIVIVVMVVVYGLMVLIVNEWYFVLFGVFYVNLLKELFVQQGIWLRIVVRFVFFDWFVFGLVLLFFGNGGVLLCVVIWL